MQVDMLQATGEMVRARPLDLIVNNYAMKVLTVIDIACAWYNIVADREKGTTLKYHTLARELGRIKKAGYTVVVRPLVIGSLGTIVGFRKELTHLELLTDMQVNHLKLYCQTAALNYADQGAPQPKGLRRQSRGPCLPRLHAHPIGLTKTKVRRVPQARVR